MNKDAEIKKKFGRRLKEIRIGMGITSQMALGNRVGLDRTYIGGIERGERNISLVNIVKIRDRLGISIEELFKF